MIRLGIMGPVGSGKSTQAKLIAQKLGICYISTGAIFRQKAQEDDQVGKKFKHQLDNGLLADDEDIAELTKQKVASVECAKGFVMDGYPRRLSQLAVWDPQLDKVFYLSLSDKAVVERLSSRGRVDDTPELINKRLKIYHLQTQPVLKAYQDQDRFIRIDGSKSIDEIAQEIAAKI